MKVVTILGAQPQFIKASPVSKALQEVGIDEVIVHTGRHFDENISPPPSESLAEDSDDKQPLQI